MSATTSNIDVLLVPFHAPRFGILTLALEGAGRSVGAVTWFWSGTLAVGKG